MRTMRAFGARSRATSRYEPLRTLLLAVGVAASTLALCGLSFVIATYDGWDARADARAPRDTALYVGEQATVRWDSRIDEFDGDRLVDAIYVDPITHDAQLPPGLAEWPMPGEVVVSPRVAEAFELDLGDDSRWGEVVGVVGRRGLIEPSEAIVYVGAGGRLDGVLSAVLASGFGSDRSVNTSLLLYRKPLGVFLGLVIVFAIAPALWLLRTAVRIGAPVRARRAQLLRTLGATEAQVRTALGGESMRGWLIGSGAAVTVAVCGIACGLPLPGIGFTIQREDLRVGWPMFLFALLLGVLGSWAVCRSSAGLSAERSRPHLRGIGAPHLRRVRILAPLVLALLTVIFENLAIGAGRVELVFFVIIAGALLTLAAVPASLAQIGRVLGDRARLSGCTHGRPGQLVGAAQLSGAPLPAARFGATCIMLMVVSAALFNALTTVGTEARNAQAVQQELEGRVAVVTPFQQDTPEAWTAAAVALQESYAVIQLSMRPDGVEELVGPEADLALVGIEGASSLPWWVAYLSSGMQQPEVRLGDVGGEVVTQGVLIVAARDGLAVDLDALKRELALVTVPQWHVEYPGGSWLTGAAMDARQAAWVVWFGGIALSLALVALWGNYANELRRIVRSIQPIQVVAPSKGFVRSVIGWRVAAPVIASVGGGVILTLILSIPPKGTGRFSLPVGFVTLCACIILCSGLLAWLLTVRSAESAAQPLVLSIPEE